MKKLFTKMLAMAALFDFSNKQAQELNQVLRSENVNHTGSRKIRKPNKKKHSKFYMKRRTKIRMQKESRIINRNAA